VRDRASWKVRSASALREKQHSRFHANAKLSPACRQMPASRPERTRAGPKHRRSDRRGSGSPTTHGSSTRAAVGTPVAAVLRPAEWVNPGGRTLSRGGGYSPKLDTLDGDAGRGPVADRRSCFACLLLGLEQDDREALTVAGSSQQPATKPGADPPASGERLAARTSPRVGTRSPKHPRPMGVA
jgi:hypothetical protein